MIFHFAFELPVLSPVVLNHESLELTAGEVEILKGQIRKNTRLVHEYVMRLDLLVNKECYPRGAAFIQKIRHQLEILMEENDTFRRVLWRHYRMLETLRSRKVEIL